MATWTQAYRDKLPDSAFAGTKFGLGRKLPVYNHLGNVSIAHVENALARVNQVKHNGRRISAAKVKQIKAYLYALKSGNIRKSRRIPGADPSIHIPANLRDKWWKAQAGKARNPGKFRKGVYVYQTPFSPWWYAMVEHTLNGRVDRATFRKREDAEGWVQPYIEQGAVYHGNNLPPSMGIKVKNPVEEHLGAHPSDPSRFQWKGESPMFDTYEEAVAYGAQCEPRQNPCVGLHFHGDEFEDVAKMAKSLRKNPRDKVPAVFRNPGNRYEASEWVYFLAEPAEPGRDLLWQVDNWKNSVADFTLDWLEENTDFEGTFDDDELAYKTFGWFSEMGGSSLGDGATLGDSDLEDELALAMQASGKFGQAAEDIENELAMAQIQYENDPDDEDGFVDFAGADPDFIGIPNPRRSRAGMRKNARGLRRPCCDDDSAPEPISECCLDTREADGTLVPAYLARQAQSNKYPREPC